jgi:hypothetical protein
VPIALRRRWAGRCLPLLEVWAQLAGVSAMAENSEITLVMADMVLPWLERRKLSVVAPNVPRIACLVTGRDRTGAVVSFAGAEELAAGDLLPALLRGRSAIAAAGLVAARRGQRDPVLLALRRLPGIEALEVDDADRFLDVIGPAHGHFAGVYRIAHEEAGRDPRVRAAASSAQRHRVYRQLAARARRRLGGVSTNRRLMQL